MKSDYFDNEIKKICFISHNATRTGAPIVLLNFLKWFKLNFNNVYFEIWLLEDGELRSEFELLGPCKVMPTNHSKNVILRILKKVFRFSLQKKFLRNTDNYDLLFFNTIASLRIFKDLEFKGRKIIWIHEQPFSIKMWYLNEALFSNLETFDRVLSVSVDTISWLKQNLIKSNIRVEHIQPFVNINVSKKKLENKKSNELIIGGCGLQEWRKGPDYFLKVAKYCSEHLGRDSIKFIWIGAEGGYSLQLKYEQQKLEITDLVEFIGQVKNPEEYFIKMDLFILTSREDPFPLVVLEAASFGIPIICFNGVGDIQNFVKVIPENIIPYGMAEIMAERICWYVKNREYLLIHGEQFRRELEIHSVQIGSEKLSRSIFNTFS